MSLSLRTSTSWRAATCMLIRFETLALLPWPRSIDHQSTATLGMAGAQPLDHCDGGIGRILDAEDELERRRIDPG